MKNKLYCNVCKWQCYDKWQLRLHNDRLMLNKKNEEENGVDWKVGRKRCPIGFPPLSKKRKWGGRFGCGNDRLGHQWMVVEKKVE